MTPQQAEKEGYFFPKQMSDGRIMALQQNLYTIGLVIIDNGGVLSRWCYENGIVALKSLLEWDGAGDPPGMWTKQKLPVERMNPNWSKST